MNIIIDHLSGHTVLILHLSYLNTAHSTYVDHAELFNEVSSMPGTGMGLPGACLTTVTSMVWYCGLGPLASSLVNRIAGMPQYPLVRDDTEL